MINFVSKFPYLRLVKLGNIYSITDETMNGIARYCPHLHTLEITGCWRVTDQGKNKNQIQTALRSSPRMEKANDRNSKRMDSNMKICKEVIRFKMEYFLCLVFRSNSIIAKENCNVLQFAQLFSFCGRLEENNLQFENKQIKICGGSQSNLQALNLSSDL